MKLEKIKIENEAGEVAELTRVEYVKHIVDSQKVEDFVDEESGTTPAKKVVEHILKSLEAGEAPDEKIAAEYTELITVIETDFKLTVESKVDKAAEAAARKEAKEKAKAEEEAKAEKAKSEALALQTEFGTSVATGAQVASAEFEEELKTLSSSLPEGVSVVAKGSGYSLDFGANATKETIGQTLGYLLQKSENSAFIGNQANFWVGDTISISVEKGIYATAKEASTHIAKIMSESLGRNIEAASLPQYQRMAERTPVELRNPKADSSAYLAVAGMKLPKKGENEKDEAFKQRTEAFEKDREEVQNKISSGEVLKRKDVLPLVDAVLIKHGLKVVTEKPEFSIGEQLQYFFHATIGLEELLNVQKPDVAEYVHGTDKVTLSREELEQMQASARANLVNALYTNTKLGLTPADFFRGYVEKQVDVEVAKSADGKKIMESQKVKTPVRPALFYTPEKEEAPAAEEAAPTEATEAPAKKKGK